MITGFNLVGVFYILFEAPVFVSSPSRFILLSARTSLFRFTLTEKQQQQKKTIMESVKRIRLRIVDFFSVKTSLLFLWIGSNEMEFGIHFKGNLNSD